MSDVAINALSSILVWFGKIFVVVFRAMWNITIDLIIVAFDLFLSAIGALISSVPASQSPTQYSLQSLIGQMGSGILYFVPIFNTSQDLTTFGAGVVFWLFVCKLFTLGQW